MSDYKSIAVEFDIKTPEKLLFEDRILIVESQNDVRLILAHHLTKLGYKSIKQCSDGHEAIEWMRETGQSAALTIADYDLPLLGALQILKELSDSQNMTRGPFIVSMNSPDKNKIMLSTESSVDGILVKPFSFNDIIPKIKQAFKVFHNPQNPEVVYEYAKKSLSESRVDEAEKIYTRLSSAALKSARPCVGLARVALSRGDLKLASEMLAAAEARNPNYVPIYVEKGNLLVKQSKLDEAVSEYRKAIELSPLNPVRYDDVARLLFEQKRYQDAIDVLTIATSNGLSFPSLHQYLSQSYFQTKEYKKAISHVKSALVSEPENVVYLNQLGICYKESSQEQEALKIYNQIIKLDPDNKAAVYNKAILLKKLGKHEEAVKMLTRCVEKFPDFQAAKKKLLEFKEQEAS